jgi:hypothetical protein
MSFRWRFWHRPPADEYGLLPPREQRDPVAYEALFGDLGEPAWDPHAPLTSDEGLRQFLLLLQKHGHL